MTAPGDHGDAPVGDEPVPPRHAMALAERCVDDRMREAVLGDLVESFRNERVRALGPLRARLWFWRQTVLAIAHFPAHVRFSNSTGDGPVTGFLDDLLRAARTMRRAPAHTLLCAATLGIGVGAATAIFSVADPIVLRPLPYATPERLFFAWENDEHGERSNVGFATYEDVAREAKTLERSAAVGSWQPILTQGGAAVGLTGLRVSWGYFRMLGVRPAIGRDFNADEDTQAANGVVVISNALWRSQFGGDSSAVGRMVDISGRQMLIAGVMGGDFDDVLQPGAQIWRVLGYESQLPFACRSCRHLRMLARIRPGTSESAASAELDGISARLVAAHPRDYPAAGFHLVQAQQEVTRDIRPALGALLIAVVLVLLIAAANVCGLQLARALQRREEFAIRAALGAGAARITRQLVAEGLALAAAAGVIGWFSARVSLSALVARLPGNVPRLAAVHLDWRAFGLATAATILAGLAMGLFPAWQVRRTALAVSLRGARRVSGTSHRVRSALVVSEVALAVMLLAGAGLLTRSLGMLLAVNPGVSLTNVATAGLTVSGARYNNNASVWSWQDQAVESARHVPGVTSAALASQLPLGGNADSYGIQAEDRPLAQPELAPSADRYAVTTDFLRTMGIRIVEGRDFGPGDNHDGAAPVAVVSQALARRIWGTESAIGKRIHLGEPTRPWYTVIGVANDVHHRGLDVAETMQVYIPTRSFFFADNGVDLVVRTSGAPAGVMADLKRAVVTPDPLVVITRLATMRDVAATSTARRRFTLALFDAFALVAIALAGAGLFGALAGMVAERTREIGLRSALGATPGAVVGLVLRQGLGMTALGAAIGFGGAFAGGRLIESLLYGVHSGDVVAMTGVAGVLAIAAVAASAIPAWRAVSVDPMTALRAD